MFDLTIAPNGSANRLFNDLKTIVNPPKANVGSEGKQENQSNAQINQQLTSLLVGRFSRIRKKWLNEAEQNPRDWNTKVRKALGMRGGNSQINFDSSNITMLIALANVFAGIPPKKPQGVADQDLIYVEDIPIDDNDKINDTRLAAELYYLAALKAELLLENEENNQQDRNVYLQNKKAALEALFMLYRTSYIQQPTFQIADVCLSILAELKNIPNLHSPRASMEQPSSIQNWLPINSLKVSNGIEQQVLEGDRSDKLASSLANTQARFLQTEAQRKFKEYSSQYRITRLVAGADLAAQGLQHLIDAYAAEIEALELQRFTQISHLAHQIRQQLIILVYYQIRTENNVAAEASLEKLIELKKQFPSDDFLAFSCAELSKFFYSNRQSSGKAEGSENPEDSRKRVFRLATPAIRVAFAETLVAKDIYRNHLFLDPEQHSAFLLDAAYYLGEALNSLLSEETQDLATILRLSKKLIHICRSAEYKYAEDKNGPQLIKIICILGEVAALQPVGLCAAYYNEVVLRTEKSKLNKKPHHSAYATAKDKLDDNPNTVMHSVLADKNFLGVIEDQTLREMADDVLSRYQAALGKTYLEPKLERRLEFALLRGEGFRLLGEILLEKVIPNDPSSCFIPLIDEERSVVAGRLGIDAVPGNLKTKSLLQKIVPAGFSLLQDGDRQITYGQLYQRQLRAIEQGIYQATEACINRYGNSSNVAEELQESVRELTLFPDSPVINARIKALESAPDHQAYVAFILKTATASNGGALPYGNIRDRFWNVRKKIAESYRTGIEVPNSFQKNEELACLWNALADRPDEEINYVALIWYYMKNPQFAPHQSREVVNMLADWVREKNSYGIDVDPHGNVQAQWATYLLNSEPGRDGFNVGKPADEQEAMRWLLKVAVRNKIEESKYTITACQILAEKAPEQIRSYWKIIADYKAHKKNKEELILSRTSYITAKRQLARFYEKSNTTISYFLYEQLVGETNDSDINAEAYYQMARVLYAGGRDIPRDTLKATEYMTKAIGYTPDRDDVIEQNDRIKLDKKTIIQQRHQLLIGSIAKIINHEKVLKLNKIKDTDPTAIEEQIPIYMAYKDWLELLKQAEIALRSMGIYYATEVNEVIKSSKKEECEELQSSQSIYGRALLLVKEIQSYFMGADITGDNISQIRTHIKIEDVLQRLGELITVFGKWFSEHKHAGTLEEIQPLIETLLNTMTAWALAPPEQCPIAPEKAITHLINYYGLLEDKVTVSAWQAYSKSPVDVLKLAYYYRSRPYLFCPAFIAQKFNDPRFAFAFANYQWFREYGDNINSNAIEAQLTIDLDPAKTKQLTMWSFESENPDKKCIAYLQLINELFILEKDPVTNTYRENALHIKKSATNDPPAVNDLIALATAEHFSSMAVLYCVDKLVGFARQQGGIDSNWVDLAEGQTQSSQQRFRRVLEKEENSLAIINNLKKLAFPKQEHGQQNVVPHEHAQTLLLKYYRSLSFSKEGLIKLEKELDYLNKYLLINNQKFRSTAQTIKENVLRSEENVSMQKSIPSKRSSIWPRKSVVPTQTDGYRGSKFFSELPDAVQPEAAREINRITRLLVDKKTKEDIQNKKYIKEDDVDILIGLVKNNAVSDADRQQAKAVLRDLVVRINTDNMQKYAVLSYEVFVSIAEIIEPDVKKRLFTAKNTFLNCCKDFFTGGCDFYESMNPTIMIKMRELLRDDNKEIRVKAKDILKLHFEICYRAPLEREQRQYQQLLEELNKIDDLNGAGSDDNKIKKDFLSFIPEQISEIKNRALAVNHLFLAQDIFTKLQEVYAKVTQLSKVRNGFILGRSARINGAQVELDTLKTQLNEKIVHFDNQCGNCGLLYHFLDQYYPKESDKESSLYTKQVKLLNEACQAIPVNVNPEHSPQLTN